MPARICAFKQPHGKFLWLGFHDLQMHDVPCGFVLALNLFIYLIKCVEAGLNPLGLNIQYVYADGRSYSVGEAQICVHSGYKGFKHEVLHTVSWDKFLLSPLHR